MMMTQGPIYIRLHRSAWRTFRSAVPDLRTPGVKVKLNDGKNVSVSVFKGKVMTTFSVKTSSSAAHINLNEGSWLSLLGVLPEIDQEIPPGVVNPCSTCQNEVKFVKLHNGCLKESELDDDRRKEIDSYNTTVQNQLGLLCGYCGVPIGFDCHCHQVDCRQCSPDCFCNTCGKGLYYAQA